MGEKRTANRTAAYQLNKDFKAQERKEKERKALAKKNQRKNIRAKVFTDNNISFDMVVSPESLRFLYDKEQD